MARKKIKASELLARYPSWYAEIFGEIIEVDGEKMQIRARVNNTDLKPPLFLWSVDRNCFVSSLEGRSPKSLDFTTWDTVRGDRKNWILFQESGSVKILYKGYDNAME